MLAVGLLSFFKTSCAAQKAGAARPDIGVPEVKALLVGCQAMQSYNSELAERTVNVVLDGLRSP